MIDHVAVVKKMRETLLNVASPYLPAPARFAWENAGFTPPDPQVDDPDGARWVRERYMPGSERQVAFSHLELIAVMQYDCLCPAGGGTEELRALVGCIGDAFKAGTGLLVTGPQGTPVQISLLRVEPSRGDNAQLYGQEWFMISLRVTFRAYGTV